jgi:superfamily II DNA or RNA helicase
MLRRETDSITLRDWQAEIFRSVEWTGRLNMIITMPTASGKSILIDMAIHSTTVGRADYVIIGQPFIALCMETVKYLKRHYKSRNITSMFSSAHGYPTRNSVIVATYENICRALENCRAITTPARIELIIDEVHNIYDSGRGSCISESIVKALYFCDTRIIMMTATLEQDALAFLQDWTNAYHYTRNTGTSHVPIVMVCNTMRCSILRDGVFEKAVIPDEIKSSNAVVSAIELLRNLESARIIIFTNTRNKTTEIAEEICTSLHDSHIAAAHNALLESEEKKVIVRMFNNGAIRCIICTSTLSTGVNLKDVTHVFVVGSTKWNGNIFAPYQRAELYQMCGRVARTEGSRGKAYLFEGSNECECGEFARAFATPSTVGRPKHITNDFAVRVYVKNYPYETRGDPQTYPQDIFAALPDCLQAIDFSTLRGVGEFNTDNVPSVRLAAVARSGLGLDEGMELVGQMTEHARNMNVTDEFHLLTLCAPEIDDDLKRLCDAGSTEWKAFSVYMQNVRNPLIASEATMIKASATYAVMKGRPGTAVVNKARKKFAAFLVMRWIPGIWDADSILLAPVLDKMMLKAEKILRLCLELHLSLVAVLVDHISVRLRNGTSCDKNALGCLPSCSRPLARALHKLNLRYIEQVASMQVSVLADLISADARRKNKTYNTAVAARMIKEAKRLSFAGSAIVPLTK